MLRRTSFLNPADTSSSTDPSEFKLADLKSYRSFNDFFARELQPGLRAPQGGPDRIVSPADSKVVVYPNVYLTRKFWIKSHDFTVANLIGAAVPKKDANKVEFIAEGDWKKEAGRRWTEEDAKEVAKAFEGGSIGSFRLNIPVGMSVDRASLKISNRSI